MKKENLDGIKFFLDAPTPDKGAEAWVLLRASGTEPLLRIYAEAASPELVDEILASGRVIRELAVHSVTLTTAPFLYRPHVTFRTRTALR